MFKLRNFLFCYFHPKQNVFVEASKEKRYVSLFLYFILWKKNGGKHQNGKEIKRRTEKI